MRLNALDGPRVLIASSGMMTGGRILHHLRRLLPDRRNLLLLAGYQAPGTRGWRIQRGEEFVRIHGRDVHVKAQVARISGLSAHADADQLLRWVRDLPPPRRTFVVHGDDGASEALAGYRRYCWHDRAGKGQLEGDGEKEVQGCEVHKVPGLTVREVTC